MNVGWGGLVGGGYVEINISQGHKTTETSPKGGLHRELCRPGAPDGSGLCGSGLRPHHPGQDCPGRAHPGGGVAFVDAPLFEEFPLTLECQVVERSDGPGGVRIVGQVVNMSAR